MTVCILLLLQITIKLHFDKLERSVTSPLENSKYTLVTGLVYRMVSLTDDTAIVLTESLVSCGLLNQVSDLCCGSDNILFIFIVG